MELLTNSEEVNNAVSFLKLTGVEVLSPEKSSDILNSILLKYTTQDRYQYPLWETITHCKSVQRDFAWIWYKELFRGKPVILFFDYADDKSMLFFPNGEVLTGVFENCYRFTHYLTDLEQSFLLANNDHNYLIGGGAAVEWIEDISRSSI